MISMSYSTAIKNLWENILKAGLFHHCAVVLGQASSRLASVHIAFKRYYRMDVLHWILSRTFLKIFAYDLLALLKYSHYRLRPACGS